MVDRITPATTPADIEKLKSVYGIDDAWPVVCEPFIQWVVEDNYITEDPNGKLPECSSFRMLHHMKK